MGDKLKILLLSAYLPAKDTVAYARKIYDFIRLLKQRGHIVHLLAFCSQEDRKRIVFINQHCASIDLEYLEDYRCYPSKSICFQNIIKEFIRNKTVDIIQCENSYLRRYIPSKIKMPLVLVEHEVLSFSFWERALFENNFINKLILHVRAIKKSFEEKKWYSKFNQIIVFSEFDKNIIVLKYKINNVKVIALGINVKEQAVLLPSEKTGDLIFVGNFSHAPNVDAVLYFYREILPLIKKNFPKVSFLIVGANPPLAVINLANLDPQIKVTGYLEDLKNVYAQSKVFVAPVRYGSGMRFKILEAMAMGVPVVTSLVGLRGIMFQNLVKVADKKQAFADAVIELLSYPEKRQALSASAREAAEEYYDWDKLLIKYDDVYCRLINNQT